MRLDARWVAVCLCLGLCSACGPSGSFQIGSQAYAAESVEAQLFEEGGLTGLDIVLESDPVRAVIDDELAVRVTLLWAKESPPIVNRDLHVSGESYVALVRVRCACGSKADAFVEPQASGKVRFSRLAIEGSNIDVQGELELTFKGQIALISGGVFEETELKVRAAGFRVAQAR